MATLVYFRCRPIRRSPLYFGAANWRGIHPHDNGAETALPALSEMLTSRMVPVTESDNGKSSQRDKIGGRPVQIRCGAPYYEGQVTLSKPRQWRLAWVFKRLLPRWDGRRGSISEHDAAFERECLHACREDYERIAAEVLAWYKARGHRGLRRAHDYERNNT